MFIMVLFSLCCLADCIDIYIIPSQGNCSVNHTTLSPCYTFEQLIHEEVISRSLENHIALFLLPGIHLIPENQSLHAYNIYSISFRPWDQQEIVVIECELNTELRFNNVPEFNILSMHFTYCALQFVYTSQNGNEYAYFNIRNSIFEKSEKKYAVTIVNVREPRLYLGFSDCLFTENNGAISFSAPGFKRYFDISIDNTTFQSNWRDDYDSGGALNTSDVILHMQNTAFKNNTGRSGNAITIHSSSLSLSSTLFNESSINLINSSVLINDCLFINNLQGAITIFGSQDSTPLQSFHNSIFQGNRANSEGGALSIINARVNITNCMFKNNSAVSGGVIYIRYNTESLGLLNSIFHNSSFYGNNAKIEGGVLYIADARTNCLFKNNSADSGGAIHINYTEGLGLFNSSFLDSTFQDNHAKLEGGALYIINARVSIIDCQFKTNSAKSGGSIYIDYYTVSIFIYNSYFQNNHAKDKGGALCIANAMTSIIKCQFEHNSAYSGGAIYIVNTIKSSHIFNSTCVANKAEDDGGAIYCKNVAMVYIEQGSSISNSAANANGGFAYLLNCHPYIYHHVISNNEALNGGAIYATAESETIFDFEVTMSNNTAKRCGGAIYFRNAKLSLLNQSIVTFNHNMATDNGGAIFVQDNNCEDISYFTQCFIHYTIGPELNMIFKNNSAKQGHVLYGGLLDRCFHNGDTLGIVGMKSISKYKQTPLAITSDPLRVCLCNEDYTINYTKRDIFVSKTRGGVIVLLGTIVDQDGNSKESFIRARYSDTDVKLDKGEGRIKINSECKKLFYHVFTNKCTSATSILQPEGPCERSQLSNITVNIAVLPCPRGLEQSDDRCVCEGRLRQLFSTLVCDASSDSIQRKGSLMWLRYDEQYLKVHTNCPLDYCQITSDIISLTYPDQQCANYHSGVICGACQDNYSIALGGSKCLQCTSSYAFTWLFPVFALAGIALVALLLVCNLTISHGTLNGLIFYANVVSIAGLPNLQNCSIHPILSVFIAWVNLDFGVETCFYSGMDTYQKTWLQLAFPLYIWLLVGAIIVASYYSSRAMKVFGRNNVAILATLFLLSYTKILKTIITVLSFSQVLQGSADNASDPLAPYKVWTYDGNIEYLKGKHVPLFIVALILPVFLFLPYTLLLIFGQCVRSMPVRKRCVLWCIRSTVFISIMDAYHAPYNKRHRYWTGFMLLTRCVLFLAFTSSYREDGILTNMYITTIILIGVLTMKIFTTNVYKIFGMGVLELCFLLNLAITSATLYYLGGSRNNDGASCRCTSASISLSLVLFIGILAYHVYIKVNKTIWFTSIRKTILVILPLKQSSTMIPANQIKPLNQLEMKLPTKSTVELREALLASGECK